MKINVDEEIQKMLAEPWDLVLTLGGRDYPTTPLSIADLNALQAMEGVPEGRQRQILSGLFAEPRPPEAIWNAAMMTTVAAAIVGYQQGRMLKNSQAVMARAAAMAGSPVGRSTSGS